MSKISQILLWATLQYLSSFAFRSSGEKEPLDFIQHTRTDLAGHRKDDIHQENENEKVDDEDIEHEVLEQIQFVSPGSQMLAAMFDHVIDQKRDSFLPVCLACLSRWPNLV